MKKNRLILLLFMFTVIFSSNILAQKDTEEVQKLKFSRSSMYESNGITKNKGINLFSTNNQLETEIYDLFHNAYTEQNDYIYIPYLSSGEIEIHQVMEIMQKVLYDNPQMFYVDTMIGYTPSGRISLYYVDTKENIEAMKIEFDQKVNSVLSEIIKPNMSEFEKELAIHDYIVLNTEYDYDNFIKETVPKNSYTTYGTLINGIAVCEGYAETFKLLLNKVDIESMIVVSIPMNHAWNIVVLDGENYQVDVTWNDPVLDRPGQVSYKHLNLTDEQMKKNHNWEYNKYPESTDDRYSKFWDIDSPKKDEDIYYSSITDDFIYSLDTNLQRKQITSVRAPFFDIAGDDIYFSNYSNGGYLSKIKKDGTGAVEQLNSVHSIDIYRLDNYIYYTEADTGQKKSIKVDIKQSEISVVSVSLDKTKLELKEGQSSKLIESIYPNNATNKNVSWTSSNPSVATVDQSGNVSAVSEGQATITVTTIDGEKTSRCNVVVSADYSQYEKLEEAFDILADKPWTIKFNKAVNENSVNDTTIYILDENKNNVELDYEVTGSQVKLIPKQDYNNNEKYTIFITKAVKSGNEELKQPMMKSFNIVK